MDGPKSVLIIACGALAHEVTAVIRLNAWDHMAVRCLPAELHNQPDRIPEKVEALLRSERDRYADVFVAYGECGTGGRLDAVLEKYDVQRVPGAHCYEFFAGSDRFTNIHDAEPGTFYLTDFLARHFERLIVRGLGLDRFPELLPAYFGNYRRLMYLSQRRDPDLLARAEAAAARIGLEFEHCETDYGGLEVALTRFSRRTEPRHSDIINAPGRHPR